MRLRGDNRLMTWFAFDQISCMSGAIEDNKNSERQKPRSIYGKAIAEADRELDPKSLITSYIEMGKFHEVEMQECFNRMYEDLLAKYGQNGTATLWLNTEKKQKDLANLKKVVEDKDKLWDIYYKLYYSKP